ncbi:LOW QUALITY PROTEIN: hepatic triacylglycerol lipase [Spinachia spinachia]
MFALPNRFPRKCDTTYKYNREFNSLPSALKEKEEKRRVSMCDMSGVRLLCCLLFMYHVSNGRKTQNRAADRQHRVVLKGKVSRMFSEGEDHCTLDPLQLHTFTSCGFNGSNPIIIITHGWSFDGVMESRVLRLATLKTTNLININVVITEWLSPAHTHYPTAAQSTRTVGKDIVHLVQSLWAHYQYPVRKVHLIGYSLGAHFSGFAELEGSEKIGRITGLDPARPLFEGMSPTDRLSPDDAELVDVMGTAFRTTYPTTYPRSVHPLKLSCLQAGVCLEKRPEEQNRLRHNETLEGDVTVDGMSDFGDDEALSRSVTSGPPLYSWTVLNKDKQSMAYRAFDDGVCLDCRKNRCNTLGYNIKDIRRGTSKRLYLNTRSQKPYTVHHYQLRIRFVNQRAAIEPSLTISLTGTKEESGAVPMTVFKLIPWGARGRKPQLTVDKIHVKAGETQERTSFCAMTSDRQHGEVSQDKVFVRCDDHKRGPS